MQDANKRTTPMAPPLSLNLCLTRLFLPLDDRVLTADTRPENRAWLKAHWDKPVEQTGRTELLAEIRRRHGAALLEQAIFGLARRFPELSAQKVITRPQALILGVLASVLLASLALCPLATVRIAVGLLSVAFAASGVFRVALTLVARRVRGHAPAPEVALPTYTILVPLYREAAVLPALVRGLLALDYPGIR